MASATFNLKQCCHEGDWPEFIMADANASDSGVLSNVFHRAVYHITRRFWVLVITTARLNGFVEFLCPTEFIDLSQICIELLEEFYWFFWVLLSSLRILFLERSDIRDFGSLSTVGEMSLWII